MKTKIRYVMTHRLPLKRHIVKAEGLTECGKMYRGPAGELDEAYPVCKTCLHKAGHPLDRQHDCPWCDKLPARLKPYERRLPR